jgi:hypothetical protein
LQYLAEDEQYAQQQADLEDRQERQREAIKHVMTYMYPYHNINTRIAKHPKGSPKAGQKYMWITRGGRNSFSDPKEANYPECVTVDRAGHVYVSEHTDQETYCIKSEEILAARDVPMQPYPPYILKVDRNNLAVEWKPILARVDRYELQYQLSGEFDNWKIVSAFCFTNCGTLKNVKCNMAYMFRVRAHNMIGWSEWSNVSAPLRTAPGPPSQPSAPVCMGMNEFSVSLEWAPCEEDNGSEIFCYTVRCKQQGRNQEWRDAFVGLACRCTVGDLDDNTNYFFQVFATNDVGRSEGSYSVQFTTKEAPLDVSGPVLRRAGVWEEYYDTKRQKCIYLNTKTGLRQKKVPFDMRVDTITVSDPDVEFRKKRYRFIRAIRRRAVLLERRKSMSVYVFNAPGDDGVEDDAMIDPRVATEEPVSPTVVSVMALTIERGRIFEDTFEQFKNIQQYQLSRRTRIEFIEEAGIDSGGLTKEWYLELARTFGDKKRRLFRRVASGASLGIDPRSCKLKDGGLEEFRFIGRIVGKAVFDRQLVNVQFDNSVIKALLGFDPEMEDLETIDPVYAKSLKWILDNDITNVIDETFSAFRVLPGGGEECIDLIVNGVVVEGGRNMDVTNDNKFEYVQGMINFMLIGQVQYQMDEFCQGFYEIVSKQEIGLFSVEEFSQLLSGQDDIAVSVLSRTSIYNGGIDKDSDLAVWLWEVLEEFDKEGRTKLLKFATGCPRIPLDGFDPQFTIVCSDDMEATALPRSHTCFNQLVLPPYHLAYPSNKNQGKNLLREKLLFALDNAQGFHMT